MNWNRVADTLDAGAAQIRQTAQAAFPTDFETQKEMRSRAALMVSFAHALRQGAAHQPSEPLMA